MKSERETQRSWMQGGREGDGEPYDVLLFSLLSLWPHCSGLYLKWPAGGLVIH